MARFAQVLAEALADASSASTSATRGSPPALLDQRAPAALPRGAEAGARRKHGPAAVRRLRADLERAYDLLEHGLGELERPREGLGAVHTA